MSEYEREIELYDYIEVLLKYKWIILAVTLLCGGAAWILRPPPPAPLYEADVVLMIKDLSGQTSSDSEQRGGATQSSGFYETLARDDGLKQAVIDSLGLDMSLAAIDGLLQVNVLDPGVKLTVRTRDPNLSLRLVNAWAELFVERNSDLNSEEGARYYNYVEDQYRATRDRLDSLEFALNNFESDNRIASMRIQHDALDSSATELHRNIVQLERTLIDTLLKIRSTDIRLRGMVDDHDPTYLRAMEKLQDLDAATSQNELYTATQKVMREFDRATGFDSWVDAFVSAEIDRLQEEIALLPPALANPVSGQPQREESLILRLSERLSRLRGQQRSPRAESSTQEVPADMPVLRELYDQRQRLRLALDLTVQRWVSKAQRRSLEELQRDIGDSLSAKMREHRRLERNHELLSETLDRLSTLVEEARLSRARSASDIRILTQALEARRVAQDTARQKTALAAGVGLLLSSIFSLLVEYVRKARARRAAA